MSDVSIATPEKVDEDWHLSQEKFVKSFKYSKPESEFRGGKGERVIVNLGRTDIVRGLVHVFKSGGEGSLHYHSTIDSFWFVLKGKVRFYNKDDGLIGEYAVHEGLLMPRGARYWFEQVGEETLELLHVSAFSQSNVESGRTHIRSSPVAEGSVRVISV
ncbi:MAG TPA: cupin domain-containing protein [Stellaceae bacterium]|nr:cupin domain-containing protein [Stellaceae bacterium]